MRRLLIALATLLLAGSAHAATLPYTGTLAIQLGDPAGGPGALVVPSLGTVVVNGSTGGLHVNTLQLAAGAFGPLSTSLPVTSDWGRWGSVNSVIFTSLANGNGSFTISGGPPGSGAMGLTGTAKICLLFAPCAYSNITVPLSSGPPGNGFGIGGTQTFPGSIEVTMQHSPWQLGTPSLTIHWPNSNVTSPTVPSGFAHGPASLSSSTARNSGVIQLVTVTKVYSNLTTVFPELPLIGVLNLHLVPEPTSIFLVGGGLLGLMLLKPKRE